MSSDRRTVQRILQRLLALAFVALSAGCIAGFPAGDVSPSEIPRLEQLRAQRPGDPNVLVRLGVAYHNADQPELARQTLEEAVQLPAPPAVAWAYLGDLAQTAGDYDDAERAYRRYLDEGGESASDAVRGRLREVRRLRLADEARAALAREDELTDLPPDRGTVGVMPFAIDGPEQYQVLGRGLAELLTTDLSITDRLTVLERARVQAMVDEMRLGLAGFTDPNSAARTGRLLRAGTVIQGRALIAGAQETEEARARIEALLVDATDPGTIRDAEQEGVLESLIDMETQLALGIYRELGIQLTAAEVARIEDKPTSSVQAFLAYSEGLRALDEGDLGTAAARFRSASQLDPGFESASQAAEETEDAAGGLEGAGREASVETAGAAPAPGSGTNAAENAADAAVPAGASAATETAQPTQPKSVNQSGEAENTESTAGTGVKQKRKVPIIFVRPEQRIIPSSIIRIPRPLVIRMPVLRGGLRR